MFTRQRPEIYGTNNKSNIRFIGFRLDGGLQRKQKVNQRTEVEMHSVAILSNVFGAIQATRNLVVPSKMYTLTGCGKYASSL